MSAAAFETVTTGRGRLRSRLRLGALTLAALLIAGCADHFGPGLVQLAAGRGWEPLPIRNWVVNDGISPKAMVYCTPQDCQRPGVAALLTFEGREAADMAKALALDPARLAREFSKRPKAKQSGKPKSTTTVSRFRQDGADGILVEIRARDGGRFAATAILYARRNDTLAMAIAVTDETQAAQDFARATWASR